MKKNLIILAALAFVALPRPQSVIQAEATAFDPLAVKLIDYGDAQGVIVTNNNEVFTYGYSWYGNRGDNNEAQGRQSLLSRITTSGDLASRPATDDIILAKNIGSFGLMLLTEEGRLYYNGRNDNSTAGFGSIITNVLTPRLLSGQGALATLSNGDRITNVYTNRSGNAIRFFAKSLENRLFAWGTNGTDGSLGAGQTTTVISSPIEITEIGAFGALNSGETIIDVEFGGTFGLALTSQGRLIGWGAPRTVAGVNLLPIDSTSTTPIILPQFIPLTFGAFSTLTADEKITDLVTNGSNNVTALAVTSKHRIISWGVNTIGQAGTGTSPTTAIPTDISRSGDLSTRAANETIKFISSNYIGYILVTSLNRVFTWGYNAQNQLGDGTTINRNVPTLISRLGALATLGNDSIRLMASMQATMLVTESGKLILWGYNGSGGYFLSTVNYTNMNLNAPNLNAPEPYDFTSVYQAKIVNLLQPSDYQRVQDMINAIPNVNQLTLDNIDDIAYIRAQFEALIQEDQGSILNYSFLTNAEDYLASLYAAMLLAVQPVMDAIDALPDLANITLDDRAAIEEALALYEALDSNFQPYVSNQVDLFDALTRLNALEIEAENQAAAQAVIDKINTLPTAEELDLTDAALLEEVREMVDALTEDQLALVTNIQTLLDLETLLAELVALDAAQRDAAQLVIDEIDTLPSLNALTLEDEDALISAREAYDALTPVERELVTNLDELIALEAQLLVLKQQADDALAAQAMIDRINGLPSLEALTLEDEDALIAAREAYEVLTAEQKALVTNFVDLEALEAQLLILIDEAAAESVVVQINALPSVDDLTKTDTQAVEAARTAFDALTSDQKLLVTNYQTLVDLEAQLVVLNSGFQLSETMWILIAALAGSITALLFWIFFKDRSKEKTLVVAQPKVVKVIKPVSKPVVAPLETKKLEKAVQTSTVPPTITKIELDDAILPNLETREKFASFAKVKAGNYLEITADLASTSRVVKVDTELPETLDASNRFIALLPEEVKQVALSFTSMAAFVKKTPGTYVDPGYYVEVDLEDKLVDRYILAKTRLAPTSKKGHRWVRIEKRKLKSK